MSQGNMPRKFRLQTPTQVGSRIRQLRTRAGMSLRELATRTNLTPSSISQIERGLSGGTSKSLFALANALGVSPGALFEGDDDQHLPTAKQAVSGSIGALAPDPRQYPPNGSLQIIRNPSHLANAVVRRSNRKVIRIDGNQAPIEWQLLTMHPDARGDFIEVVYQPGASSCPGQSFMQHAGWDYVVLLSGELTIFLAFDEVVLRSGDSMSFDSTIPHRLENRGKVPCRSIWFVMRGG